MLADQQITDIGLYTPYEAARYVRASTQRFNRWLYGTSDSKPVFDPQLGREERIVTFLDFAQALSIQDIRLNVGIQLQKIRDAYQRAQEEHGIQFPFAVEHGIFVFGNLSDAKNCELGIYASGKSDESRDEYLSRACFQLTGKNRGNQLISEVVKIFSKGLQFSKDGLAARYSCYSKHGLHIVMDPEVRFGKPCFDEIGYEAETLADAARIEGGEDRAAKLYGVPKNAVKAAVAYMRQLDTPPEQISPKKIPS